jgi:Na+/H+ antiporter NhaD/arsenite permease-like protein
VADSMNVKHPTGSPLRRRGRLVALAVLAASIPGTSHAAGVAFDLGETLTAWSAVPFAGLLLSIALLPHFAPKAWHRHYPKVAAAWAMVFALPFVTAFGAQAATAVLQMALSDYLPFAILLTALYTIGGGILLRGTPHGSTRVNLTFLALGAFLASLIGTTGAAIVLIRPLLRANRARLYRAHTVVFFIFLVANIGGALTPLGDPPLFLGFLHGVPFFWTLRLWRETALVAGVLLAVYAALDAFLRRREPPGEPGGGAGRTERLRLEGAHNLLLIGGVLLAVVGSGVWHPGQIAFAGVSLGLQDILRDVLLVVLTVVSWRTTSHRTRAGNHFTWGPMREVAILFAAIFLTIIPLLEMLRAGAHGPLAAVTGSVQNPGTLFWTCGGLSSVLDNAPTYLAFLSTALGALHPWLPAREAVAQLVVENPVYLAAIATGAVFMGATTYIGNAPNFMVRSIAEEAGIEMPSFLGYVLRYSLPILLPTFALMAWIFF